MKKYRVNRAQGENGGYNLYLMRDMGNGWSKEFISHYATREEAEQAAEQKTLFEEGCKE